MSKKTFRGIMCLIIVLILTAAIVICCGIGSSWFTNKDFKTWFNGWGQSKPIEGETDDGGEDGEGEGNDMAVKDSFSNLVLTEEVGDKRVRLTRELIAPDEYEDYGISPQAEGAFTWTATAYYDDGSVAADSEQYFVFNLAWASSNSASVSSYIKMSVTSDRSATFSFMQGFSTQIVATCTYLFNDSISQTLKMDYAKRFSTLNTNLKGSSQSVGNEGRVNVQFSYAGGAGTTAWMVESLKFYDGVNYSTSGTVDNELTGSNVTVEYSDSFKSALTSKLSSFCPASAYRTMSGNSTVSQYDILKGLVNWDSNPSLWMSSYFTTYKNVFVDTSNQIKVTATLDFKYGESVTMTYYINVTYDVSVASIQTNNNGESIIY